MIRGMVPTEIELQRIFWRSFLSLCCFCDAIDDLLTLVPGCPPPSSFFLCTCCCLTSVDAARWSLRQPLLQPVDISVDLNVQEATNVRMTR